jgi:nicotinamide mononucleotide transporter
MYFLPLQFHGFYKWNKEIDLEVKALTIIEKVKYAYLCFIFWYIFYFEIPGFTKFVTQQEYPYETNILARVLDSGGTSLSIIAQYLLINKYYESWILWTIVNVFQIIMFSGINDFISVNIIIMTCIYQLNAFYGLYLWTRKNNSADLINHTERANEHVSRVDLVNIDKV